MGQELRSQDGKIKQLANSLSGLFGNFFSNNSQLSRTDTQYYNLRYYLVSNDRLLLNYMYTEHGIVQTLIDQPVDDGFREGILIRTEQLDSDEIKELEVYLERHRVIETIKQAFKWARLFGGGAIIIMTDQKPDTPLEPSKLKKGGSLSFRSADMWEMTQLSQGNEMDYWTDPEYYMYYGQRIHKSRVFRINGKEAPSLLRPHLRGWGMSEVEKLVRSINQYMKNQDVIFELMDEAKVDVYKIDGFNDALATEGGTQAVAQRIQLANQLKNFQSAITMDVSDDYEQKQMNFTGLSELLKGIREGIAADLKMPVTKVFGISSAGFNSGEDDIENYNGMIESEIRSKSKYAVVDVLCLICQNIFGVIPDDLSIEFPELRMMSTEQQELAKTNEFNRIMSSYQSGLSDGKTAKEAINKAELLPVDLDEDTEVGEDLGEDFTISDQTVTT